jgi:hypothetical protein
VLAHDAGDLQLALLVARLLSTADTPPAAAGAAGAAAAGSSSSSGGGSSGGLLLQRLVGEELLPLAEADPDPAAAALAACMMRGSASGGSSHRDGAAAALQVLLMRLLAGHVGGCGTLSGLQLLPAAAAPAPAAGTPPPPNPGPAALSQLPLLLHWVVGAGLDALGGRAVSGALVPLLHRLALRVARCAEVAGLPLAAAEALALADALGDPCSPPVRGEERGAAGGVLEQVLLLLWRARLAAAVLALQLVPPAGGGSGGGSDSDSSSKAQAAAAPWQAAVQAQLPLLAQVGLTADAAAVAALLARHALARTPMLQFAAGPLGRGWCFDVVWGSSSGGSGVCAGEGQASPGAAAGVAPDAVLAACLSRAGSVQGGSAAASPALLSRAGSLAALAQPSTAAAGGQKGAAFGVGGRPDVSSLQPPAPAALSSRGPGWGSAAAAAAAVAAAAAAAARASGGLQLLGPSWELARQQGDKASAVAACSGAQFSCLVLLQQQHQCQQQQRGHSPLGGRQQQQRGPRMQQPGSSCARPRPLIFACKSAGIRTAELLAPAALPAHWAAAAQARCGGSSSSKAVGSPRSPFAAAGTPASPLGAAAASPSAAAAPGAAGLAAASAGSLSGFMSQVLDQLRWPPDPWVVGEFPHQRPSGGLHAGRVTAGGHPGASLAHVHTAALATHPTRPLFVSGSSSGRIHLWAFGEGVAKAAYVPVANTSASYAASASPAAAAAGGAGGAPQPQRLLPHEAVCTPHWGGPAALRFSRSGARFGAVGEGGLVGLWRQDMLSALDGMGHAEWLGHCLARCGTGLAFLGDTGSQVLASGVGEAGGTVVLVDTLAPPSAAAAATLLSRRGVTPTALALVPTSAGAASVAVGGGAPGAVLVVGDDAGVVTGYDVRMLAEQRPLWAVHHQQQQQQPGAGGAAAAAASAAAPGNSAAGITSLACWDAAWVGGGSSGSASSAGGGAAAAAAAAAAWTCMGGVVASGSRDGSITLWDVSSGALLQALPLTHYTERRGLLERVGLGGGSSSRGVAGASDAALGGHDAGEDSVVMRTMPANAVPAAVTGLHACGEGLLSCGADGVLRFHPLTQLLDSWVAAGDV